MSKLIAIIFPITLLVLLSLRMFYFYQSKPAFKDGQSFSIQTTLLSEPQISGMMQSFSVNVSGTKIYVSVPRLPEYHYGDNLKISGIIKINAQNISNKKQSLSLKSVKIENQVQSPPWLAVLSSFRQKITGFFKSNLSPVSASLLLGIVFGIKDSMPKEFMDHLKVAGVMHVIAASGMNVTLIGGFLSSFLILFFKRQVALTLSIAGIVVYAVLAGLEPSIVRAAIMGVLVFSSQIIGRQNTAAYSLFLAAFIMLFISPFLIEDVGFQLSFLATAGILYIQPIFKHGKIGKLPVLGEAITTTLSAQLATLPIMLITFGTLSLWSIVVNALVLWTVPILTILGGIAALTVFVLGPVSKLLLFLSLPLLLYFERLIIFFAKIGGLVKITNFNWFMFIGYYLLLCSFIWFLRKQEVSK
jgi:competence protein ComEC